MMEKKYHRYIIIAVFLGLIALAVWVVKPFIISILTSAAIAYVFYPIFKVINNKIKHKFISAIIVTIIIVLVISVPLILAANIITKEAYLLYLLGKQRISGDILQQCSNYFCEMVKNWASDVRVQYYFQEALKTSTEYILNGISKFVLGIPSLAINLLISFFVVFYLLKDGDVLIEKIKQLLKIEERDHKTITKKLDEVMFAVIYGNLIVALIQGSIGALSFMIFGISSPIIWGVIMAIVSFAPYIGTAVIWIPASLILILDGVNNDQSLLIWKGIGLLLVNILAGGIADNVIKPKIIGSKSSVHPVIIMVGIFGGIYLFGIAGFIIGPVVLALAATVIDMYLLREDGYHNHHKDA